MEFITQFWKNGMQSQSSRDAEQHERVAVTSIYAQRVVDQFANPEMTAYRGMDEPRVMDRPMYGVVHADLKNTDAGTCSTFMAANYYNEEANKRRDELLAKYEDKAEK